MSRSRLVYESCVFMQFSAWFTSSYDPHHLPKYLSFQLIESHVKHVPADEARDLLRPFAINFAALARSCANSR